MHQETNLPNMKANMAELRGIRQDKQTIYMKSSTPLSQWLLKKCEI
jgi:hypothetical protein